MHIRLVPSPIYKFFHDRHDERNDCYYVVRGIVSFMVIVFMIFAVVHFCGHEIQSWM